MERKEEGGKGEVKEERKETKIERAGGGM